MDEKLAAERYRWLVEQIRDELDGAHGWKEEAARRLGVSGVFVGMVESGKRQASAKALAAARKSLGLDWRYFHDPDLGDRPDYREHIVSGPEAHWQAFVARFERIGDLDATQLSEIKAFAARTGMRVRSPADYERLAEMVLRDQPSEIFERKRRGNGEG